MRQPSRISGECYVVSRPQSPSQTCPARRDDMDVARGFTSRTSSQSQTSIILAGAGAADVSFASAPEEEDSLTDAPPDSHFVHQTALPARHHRPTLSEPQQHQPKTFTTRKQPQTWLSSASTRYLAAATAPLRASKRRASLTDLQQELTDLGRYAIRLFTTSDTLIPTSSILTIPQRPALVVQRWPDR